MISDHVFVYFDFVDPGSYLLHQLLEQIPTPAESLKFVGMELASPPNEMIDPEAPSWRSYCEVVDGLAHEGGCVVPHVDFVPWTRKAHELTLHAAQVSADTPIIEALFRAHFEDRRDLGRIDVLTEIAHECGLDRSETKAVLDVDKYTNDLSALRITALDEGVVRVPTMRRGTQSLVGPAGIHDLRILFESPGGPITGT